MRRHSTLFAAVLGIGLLATACSGSTGQPPAASAPTPVAVAARPSLYHRLGGIEAIRAVVADFVPRVAADARINAFFAGADLKAVGAKLVAQICQVTGGGCRYYGRSMREAHAGMDITDAHFDALVEDLAASLDGFRVPAPEKQELLAILGALRGDIVTAR